jgi:hypothetical protein
MGISDVVSPVSRKGSRVGSMSGQPLSPGARSDPGRGDQTEAPAAALQRRDRTASHQEQPSAQPQPQRPDRRVAAHQEPPIGSMPIVTGPED